MLKHIVKKLYKEWRYTTQQINREMNLIAGEKALWAVLLIAPVLYGLFYGSVYWYKTEQNVPIAVVDAAPSDFSRKLEQQLEAHPMLSVTQMQNFADAEKALRELEIFGIIVLDENLQKNVLQGKQSIIPLFLNNGRFLMANDINRAVNETIGTMSAGIRVHKFAAKGYAAQQAMDNAVPIQVSYRSLCSPQENYGQFFIPGLLMVVWQQTLLIALGISIANERENQQIPTWKKNNANNWLRAFGNKTIFYTLLYLVYALFFITVLYPLYGLHMRGNGWLLSGLFLLQTLTLGAMALFLTSFISKKITAMQLFALSSYPFFLASGFSWPLFNMSAPVRVLGFFFPHTPFLHMYTRITQMDAGLADIWPLLLHLLALCILYTTLAIFRYQSLTINEKNMQTA